MARLTVRGKLGSVMTVPRSSFAVEKATLASPPRGKRSTSIPPRLMVVLAACLAGCGPATESGRPGGQGVPWAIAVAASQGPNHNHRARFQAQQMAQATGAAGFRAVNEGAKSVVYFGNFSGPDSAEAQAALSELRRFAARGLIPGDALLLSPVAPSMDAKSPYDLRRVTAEDAVYTLQVARFDANFGEGFREAAEALAREYRAQGHQAYHYHGPRMSLVTVGVFGHAAARVATSGPNRGQAVYHERIRNEFQKKFPHMLVNGEPAEMPGNPDRRTPTFLVRIPK